MAATVGLLARLTPDRVHRAASPKHGHGFDPLERPWLSGN